MKKKIKIKTPDGKTLEKEIVTRNLEHFQIQLTNRKQIVVSKKVYNRKNYKKVEW